jgi:pyrroloquinoline-quinone synthase
MNREDFKERLLCIMEQKNHWAWRGFTSGLVAKDLLHIHLEQEYETYVRDFPIYLGRAYVQCPIAVVRRELAENLYEEETGGLSLGTPHPELFLLYPKGLGMDVERFSSVTLLPAARSYRDCLDDLTLNRRWTVAATVSTIFLEGTIHERGELDPSVPKRPTPPLNEHPLVKHYGLPLQCLALTRAHRMVEGDHRAAAWRIVLDHVPEDVRRPVVAAMEEVLEKWLLYRDEVAIHCGLVQTAQGVEIAA